MLRQQSPSHFYDGIKILLCGGALLAACAGGLCYANYQLKIAAKGPQEITGEELAKITKLADMPHPWVTFTFDKSAQTEFAMVQGSNQVEWVYDLVQVGDRWLLAGVPKDFQGNRLKDTLQSIPKKVAARGSVLLCHVCNCDQSTNFTDYAERHQQHSGNPECGT